MLVAKTCRPSLFGNSCSITKKTLRVPIPATVASSYSEHTGMFSISRRYFISYRNRNDELI